MLENDNLWARYTDRRPHVVRNPIVSRHIQKEFAVKCGDLRFRHLAATEDDVKEGEHEWMRHRNLRLVALVVSWRAVNKTEVDTLLSLEDAPYAIWVL